MRLSISSHPWRTTGQKAGKAQKKKAIRSHSIIFQMNIVNHFWQLPTLTIVMQIATHFQIQLIASILHPFQILVIHGHHFFRKLELELELSSYTDIHLCHTHNLCSILLIQDILPPVPTSLRILSHTNIPISHLRKAAWHHPHQTQVAILDCSCQIPH